MAELTFKRDHVTALADKLVRRSGLTPEERDLLLTIFEAAAGHVSEVPARNPAGEPHSDPTEFSNQLASSFLPETGSNFRMRRIRHGPPAG